MYKRIITGLVDSNGRVSDGDGFIVDLGPDGYRITFHELGRAPTIVCQAWAPPGESITFITKGQIANEVLVAGVNSHGDITECGFGFIAVSND